MEIRYIGFEQRENSRLYRFDVRADGNLTRQLSVTADIAVFRNHGVGIQEGPILSGNKLSADLERGWEGEHELTAVDLRAYADAKALADSQRASTRKPPRQKPGVLSPTPPKGPWRNFGM